MALGDVAIIKKRAPLRTLIEMCEAEQKTIHNLLKTRNSTNKLFAQSLTNSVDKIQLLLFLVEGH